MVSMALSTIRCELNGDDREQAQGFEEKDGHSIMYRQTVSAFSPRLSGIKYLRLEKQILTFST